MRAEDIPQVSEIDREAFPTLWPPTSFKRELENKTARCLVAYERRNESEKTSSRNTTQDQMPEKAEVVSLGVDSRVGRFLSRMRRIFRDHPTETNNQKIVGFAGVWLILDEAHLSSIAVQEKHRRQGIGELLLISVIELALEQKSKFVTLEVRISNLPAQTLYQKYGFNKTGLRRGYYTDNKEDALIMSTDDIDSALFQGNFQRLKQAFVQKWGASN